MGNRAVITTSDREMGVYLHWNGGRDSVEAFLKYCELRGFRTPESDSYGWARLCQVIANFFGPDGLSIGVFPYGGSTSYDSLHHPGDNGIYVIKGWEIVDRVYRGSEQQVYDLNDMLVEIDRRQPERQQLGRDYILAEPVTSDELAIGDEVYVQPYGETPKKVTVIGFGDGDAVVNGREMDGVPYVNWLCDNEGKYTSNSNNYLPKSNWSGETLLYRRVRKEH